MAAPRSIGSLTISFGLVAIPVKLYTATQSTGQISFNLLHKECGSRLKQQYVCLKDGTVVDRDDMVKGYEFAKDQYVAFSPEEIKALEEVGSHAVEISDFVPIESIDPVYYDKTYYLAPDKGASKPYALLTEALKETRRCAVGRWAAKGKAYIVALRPVDQVLTMQQLRFASEVRPASEIDIAKTEVKPAEMKLARQLIDSQQAATFDPASYVDEVRGRIEAAIQKKVEGQEISISETPEPGTLRMVATDGHRLALVDRAVVDAQIPRGVIMSRKGLSEIRKLLDETGEQELTLVVADKDVRVHTAAVSFFMRLVEGEFPDYKQVIPAEPRLRAQLTRDEFLAAMRRTSLMASERSHGVKLRLEPGTLELSASNPDAGEASEDLEVAFTGSPITIGFNGKYIIDALTVHAPGDSMELALTDEVGPGVLRGSQDPAYTYVLMPMRL